METSCWSSVLGFALVETNHRQDFIYDSGLQDVGKGNHCILWKIQCQLGKIARSRDFYLRHCLFHAYCSEGARQAPAFLLSQVSDEVQVVTKLKGPLASSVYISLGGTSDTKAF